MVFIFGSTGQLGQALSKVFSNSKPVDRKACDLAKSDEIENFFLREKIGPDDLVINAAAFTDVDRAELDRSEAKAVNSDAAKTIARISNQMIHISTDFVFDGSGTTPWTELSLPRPINWYGETKLVGEQAVLEASSNHRLLRVSWLYSDHATGFPAKTIAAAKKRDLLQIVDDQVGAPTNCKDVANFIFRLTKQDNLARLPALTHLKFEEYRSRCEWAEQILREEASRHPHFSVPVIAPISTEQFSKLGKYASRPLNCRLASVHTALVDSLAK
jgi:dTDP-4-dehydrorhamnose reductase